MLRTTSKGVSQDVSHAGQRPTTIITVKMLAKWVLRASFIVLA